MELFYNGISVDLQEGFYPRMKAIIFVDGQAAFNKEVQTNPITGFAAIIKDLHAKNDETNIKLNIPSLKFANEFKIKISNGRYFGIRFDKISNSTKITE